MAYHNHLLVLPVDWIARTTVVMSYTASLYSQCELTVVIWRQDAKVETVDAVGGYF